MQLVGNEYISADIMENSVEVLWKNESRTALGSSSLTSGAVSGVAGSVTNRRLCSGAHSNTIHSHQDMEPTQMPTEEWIKRR